MASFVYDDRLSNIITVEEVCEILIKYDVPYNEKAYKALLRTSRPRITPGYIVGRVWLYIKAFCFAVVFTVKQKLNIEGLFSKQRRRHYGRKDM